LVIVTLFAIGALFAISPKPVQASSASADIKPPSTWPGADLFWSNSVHRLRLEIAPKDLESLRHDTRGFVRAQVFEGERAYGAVAVRLRGGVGSFRPIDDKPGFTLDFDRFQSGQRFHDLRRIHLNNSVEDPSYCHEWVGSELFRQAGVPAPRVSHASLELNGRRLGLYVLKEGFTEDFLSCYFKKVGGDLYEPGEGHDVNQRLKRNSVNAPQNNPGALENLGRAVLEENAQKRHLLLSQTLDLDEFTRFMSLEIILCHRDGYCLARNNFRVYENGETKKILFFPAGMDQLLGSPELPAQPQMSGLVARALLATEEGRSLYRRTFSEMYSQVINSKYITNNIDVVLARIHPVLTSAEFRETQRGAALLKERFSQRCEFIHNLFVNNNISDIAKGDGSIRIWSPDESIEGRLDEVTRADGKRCLHIALSAPGQAAWKARALLDHGRYRFEGRAMTSNIKPLQSGLHQGAGLRIGGKTRQGGGIMENGSWHELTAEFEVEKDETEVVLICELRAASGDAWFERTSLRVIRIP
jgi:spore coat protein H